MMQNILARSGEFHDNVKKVTIKDAIFWVSEAWDLVPKDAIRKSWNMLYNPAEWEDEDDLPLSVVREKMLAISEKIKESLIHDEESAKFEAVDDDGLSELFSTHPILQIFHKLVEIVLNLHLTTL